jgi:hypothetical protein
MNCVATCEQLADTLVTASSAYDSSKRHSNIFAQLLSWSGHVGESYVWHEEKESRKLSKLSKDIVGNVGLAAQRSRRASIFPEGTA